MDEKERQKIHEKAQLAKAGLEIFKARQKELADKYILDYPDAGVTKYFETKEEANAFFKAHNYRKGHSKIDEFTVEVYGRKQYSTDNKGIKMPLDTAKEIGLATIKVRPLKGKYITTVEQFDVQALQDKIDNNKTLPAEVRVIYQNRTDKLSGPAVNVLAFLYNTGTEIELGDQFYYKEDAIPLYSAVYEKSMGLTNHAKKWFKEHRATSRYFSYSDLSKYNDFVYSKVKFHNRLHWCSQEFYKVLIKSGAHVEYPRQNVIKQYVADAIFWGRGAYRGSITEEQQRDIDKYCEYFDIPDNTMIHVESMKQCDDRSVYYDHEMLHAYKASTSQKGLPYAGNLDNNGAVVKRLPVYTREVQSSLKAYETMEVIQWCQFLQVEPEDKTMCKHCGQIIRKDMAYCEVCGEPTIEFLADLEIAKRQFAKQETKAKQIAKEHGVVFEMTDLIRQTLLNLMWEHPLDKYRDVVFDGYEAHQIEVKEDWSLEEKLLSVK